MGTVVKGQRRPFGPIANTIDGLAVTHSQIGGKGICRWKMLMNGMHLEGRWNCVEYVVIEPGGAVGEHVHTRTEEIYYIIGGEAVMTVNGVELECAAGDLITTPIGTSHAIENRSGRDMQFFVVEVFPGEGAAAEPVRVRIPECARSGPDGSVEIDLQPHFTGDWRRFRWIEIAGAGAERATPADAQVIHVLEGEAEIEVDGASRYQGGPGLSVAVPPNLARRIRNTDPARPLRAIITEVGAA